MLVLFLACTDASPDRDHEPGRAPRPPSATGSEASPAPTEPPGPIDAVPTGRGEPLVVCINEFMAANVVAFRDDDDRVADWIELHNPTGQDVPLDGWSITDDPSVPRKHELGGGLVLEAGGFLVLWADDTPTLGPTHLGFALSEDGEAVGLYAPDGTGSVVRYGPSLDDVAVERVTDCCVGPGEVCFRHVFAGSPGASNGS